MKILMLFGTRPEIIKLAPVVLSLRRFPARFETILVATAQHRGILDQMLRIFELTPDIDLDVMRPNQSLEGLTSILMEKVTAVLTQTRPDLVLIEGDTTTVMISALAAFYQKIPVGHVEAGLRTQNIYNPFPEEINRRIVSTLATYHFAPTKNAAKNLKKEGIPSSRIFVTGNTVVDALLDISRKIDDYPLPLKLSPEKRLLLVTAHRRESFGMPLENICRALKDVAGKNPDVEIVYPVHPNPNVQENVLKLLQHTERIYLTEPLDYIDFLLLMKKSYLILTDSGGIQEEAPTFKKPVLVLRAVTERPEGVAAGIAKIVGTDRKRIIEETQRLLDDREEYLRMTSKRNPYGDGKAAERIRDILLNWKKEDLSFL